MQYFLNHNYYNILYIITMSSFEDNIRKYVELDNQLKLINDKAKLIRETKNSINKNVCEYLERNNHTNSVIEITDGSLKLSETKVQTPLSYKFVEKCLGEIIPDEEKVEHIIQYIKNKREVQIEKTLKRFYKN